MNFVAGNNTFDDIKFLSIELPYTNSTVFDQDFRVTNMMKTMRIVDTRHSTEPEKSKKQEV